MVDLGRERRADCSTHLQIDLRAGEEIRDFGQAPLLLGATLITHTRAAVMPFWRALVRSP
jgi:hypothetical protein